MNSNINEISENILKHSRGLKLELESDDEINLNEGNKLSVKQGYKNFLSFQADRKLIIIVLLILCISAIAFLISLNFIKIPNFGIKFLSPENNDILVKNEDDNDIFLNNVTLANRKLKIAFVYSSLYANGIARFISVAADYFVNTGKYEVYIITEKTTKHEYKYDKRITRIVAKNRTITKEKRTEVKMVTNNFYSLKLEGSKPNKFLNKFKDTKYIYEKQSISFEKSKVLLNMQIKTKNYTSNNKRKNIIIELTEELKTHEFTKMKETYFHEIISYENSKNIINNEISQAFLVHKINNNCNTSSLLSQYILTSYEFTGLSSSSSLLKRRNAKTYEPSDENNEYGIMIQERFLKREEETFKRTKSNVFQLHNFNKNNWMRTSKNIIRIHEIILKANNFEYFNNIQNVNKSRFRRSSTLKEGRDVNHDTVKKNFIQNISSSKMNSISPMTLRKRKSIRLNYKTKETHSNYNVLEMKKFFTRNNTKRGNNAKQLHLDLKEERESSSFKSLRVLSSNNVTNYKLEEYYYVLINCIFQGLNKNFINVFQKMQKKIDINQQIYEGNTLLIFSTKEGNFAITKYLCSQGADVNIQNDEGNTALHFAIANQFFSIVDVLKASGAKEDIANNKGFTPWDCIEHEL